MICFISHSELPDPGSVFSASLSFNKYNNNNTKITTTTTIRIIILLRKIKIYLMQIVCIYYYFYSFCYSYWFYCRCRVCVVTFINTKYENNNNGDKKIEEKERKNLLFGWKLYLIEIPKMFLFWFRSIVLIVLVKKQHIQPTLLDYSQFNDNNDILLPFQIKSKLKLECFSFYKNQTIKAN